jgi:UV excision repair protein RAD23
MGFPESESRAALAAAMGNPDLAYEFLLTGIPAAAPTPNRLAQSPAGPGTPAAAGAVSIDALRRHPQFNMLKQLVQTNPAALSQVLDLIGQQSPELLAAIHANNDAFIAMMNEPIVDTPPPAPASAAPFAPPAGAGLGGNPMGNPAQMMQMLASMPAPQRAQFAAQIGMAPEQLDGLMQMMASMPPGQLESMLGGAAGAGGPGGADPPGVIRLTEEEMESVNRLVALGFSQQQAAQAYLACDKNETLAANLLFEGGWGDDDGDMGGYGGGGDEDDNMYN